jgi:NAD(P)-dependent dehydrogenase (short-subunit alcohol dehydrogenase family)
VGPRQAENNTAESLDAGAQLFERANAHGSNLAENEDQLRQEEEQMRLANKVAIVTGAGSGIGEAIALEFVREACKVVLVARRSDRLEAVVREARRIGGEAIAVAADVSRLEDIDRMVLKTVEAFGGLDILVNSAGVLLTSDWSQQDESVWDQTLDINLKGSFFCIQRAVPEMLQRGRGKIINIASIAGCAVGSRNRVAYCASKAGVMGMTRALALELAPKKINVNAICPGDVETELNAHLFKDPAYRKMRVDNTPCGRVGSVNDIAPAAVYLASDESDFVDGLSLFIDGGLSIS